MPFQPSAYSPFGTYTAGQESQLIPVDSSSGLFRYVRSQFNMAGQKSFSTPPAQDQETYETMLNTMPVTVGSLDRRWGFTAQAATTAPIYRILEFQNNSSMQRSIVTANNATATLWSEAALTPTIDPLFTFSTGADLPRLFESRQTLYAFNGLDTIKHSGIVGDTQTTTGFSAAGTSTTVAGPNFPTAETQSTLPGRPAWTNIANVGAADLTYATCA